MLWLRLYSEARNDAKLESLSDEQFRVWFRLLCFANEQPERGSIAGIDEELLAVEVAKGDVELLQETIQRLVKLRILSVGEDNVRFVNWEKRQFQSDDVTERVRKHRESKRSTHEGETLQKRCSNVDVTPTDTDTEADTEKDKTLPPPAAEAAPADPPKQSSKPRQPKDERVKPVLDHFHDRFLALEGRKPVILGPRDGNLIRKIPKEYDAAAICALMDRWFDCRGQPVVWRSGDIPSFVAVFNSLTNGKPSEPKAWRAIRNVLAEEEAFG